MELEAGRPPALLEGRNLSKRYGGTQALEDVSIRLERGRVTALAGGNGAGKSTLIRLLSAVEQPDSGEILLNGTPVQLSGPRAATRAGIFCVYQDQPFVGRFEVYQQVYLGYENHFRRFGVVSDNLMRQACRGVLDDLGLTSLISPSQRMGDLSPAVREVVALASVEAVSRILNVEHPVILLDEPTSALSVEELEFLIGFIQSLKERSALLFVSHRVTEVLEWAEALYVLRDGRDADYMTRETMAPDRVHVAMGGARPEGSGASRKIFGAPMEGTRSVSIPKGPPTSVPVPGIEASVRFSVAGVRVRSTAESFDLEVDQGEIVGLAGVEGSGKEEFLRLCAGLSERGSSHGVTMNLDGSQQRRHPRDLLRSGVVYLSGERQRDGIFAKLSISENIAMSRRAVSRRRLPVLDRRDERVRAEKAVSTLAVKTPSVDVPLEKLSGGNQQKVLIGRCLELSPRVLLLDNVTRGVDIGAKASIYEILRSLAQDGTSIVLASDDLDELITVCDRIAVFKGGAPVRHFVNARRDVESLDVLAAMV